MEEVSPCSDSDDGYDYELVHTPPDRVICVICQHPSRDPYLTECCGHVLCKSCLHKTKSSHLSRAYCPMCMDKHFFAFCNKQVDREVKCLQVYCTNKGKGCKWQGELKDIHKHLVESDGCQFEEMECSNGCGKTMQRHDLNNHMETDCPSRKIECPHCHCKGRKHFIEAEHLETCPKIAMSCPNNCGEVEMILREEMRAHRKECPLEMIRCKYHNVGCRIRMERKRRKQHEDEKMEEHLRMTSTKLAKTEDELASTKDRIGNLEVLVHQMIGKSVSSHDLSRTARWSVRLSAMEAMATSGVQTCPAFLRISDYSRRSSNWYSRPFFTHEGGYKMKLIVDTADDYDDLYLSVYLLLVRGEHDDAIAWPLRATFQISLLNQIADSEHYSEILAYDDSVSDIIAGRIMDDFDGGTHGFYTFISTTELKTTTETHQYLVDDSLFFRVCKVI